MNAIPMKKQASARHLLGVAALIAVSGVQAASGDSMFSISGFGTVGLVATDTDDAEYVVYGQRSGGRKQASAEVDSKLAVQLGVKFTSMFSATVQALSKQNGDGNFKPRAEWAFLKAQVTPDLAIRVGRVGAPLFAVSDFRDVSFANTWLRPPQDVYGQVPISHIDGADLSYQSSFGDTTLTVQLVGGKSKEVVGGTDVEATDFRGVNATVELGNGMTLRVGHVEAKLTVKSASLAGLVGLLRQLPFASVGNEIDPTRKDSSFSGVGLAYDEGNWLVNAEYTKRKTDSIIPSTTGWFLTVGHRLGKFTPYATLSELKRDDTNVNNAIPPGVAIPGVTADLRALVEGTVNSQRTDQKTTALGLRWDLMPSVAMKAQWERVKPNGTGLFVARTPGWGNERVNVLSLSVDFVF
ncbi:hypothetical protein [Inhella sp.]|uniref:hypothetical protein n=1 Tax=Inhella sp. TaxID=1921806 RepID=UPI0035B39263